MVAVLMCSPAQQSLNRFGLALSMVFVPPAIMSSCCGCCRMLSFSDAAVQGLAQRRPDLVGLRARENPEPKSPAAAAGTNRSKGA